MLKEFKNWKEISKGYYRYVISFNVAYEIIVEYWNHSTPIETAKSSLCLVGDWRNKDGSNSSVKYRKIFQYPTFCSRFIELSNACSPTRLNSGELNPIIRFPSFNY